MKFLQHKTFRQKRARAGRTNYTARAKLLRSGLPRLVVRKSNTAITLQLVDYRKDGDFVYWTLNSSSFAHLEQISGKNLVCAYVMGIVAGHNLLNFSKVIIDICTHYPVKDSSFFGWAVVDGVCKVCNVLTNSDHEVTRQELNKQLCNVDLSTLTERCLKHYKSNESL